jgi:hypothetical protein
LRDLDHDLERLVCDYLDSVRVRYRRVPSGTGWLLETDADAQLSEPLRAGLRIVLGGESATALEDRLTLGHPLVRLAVDAARGATAQPFSVRVSGAQFEALRGRRGRLRLEKLRYPGFEPVDRLLPVAVLESAGAGVPAAPLDAAATLSLLRGPLEPAAALGSRVSDAELEDAALEAAFLDEHEVSNAEQRSFARAMAQLERYVEDRALIQRRDRSRVEGALQKAREQIAAAPGADARSRAENVLTRAQRELEAIDAELERLESRQDEGYRRWREQAHMKRYAPPSRELILEAEFVVG